jgi:hypothetical protein
MNLEQIKAHLPVMYDYIQEGYIPLIAAIDLIEQLIKVAPADFTFEPPDAMMDKVIYVDFGGKD